MKRRAIFLLVLFAALSTGEAFFDAYAQDSPPLNAEQIKAQFFDRCLTSSKDKYELYKNCIGKFAKACMADPDKFYEVRKDFSTGVHFECTEVESKWWDDLYDDYTKRLKLEVHKYLKDKRISGALKETLAALNKRYSLECQYPVVRWGLDKDGGANREGIADEFECDMQISGENAITVYLWDNELRKYEHIQ